MPAPRRDDSASLRSRTQPASNYWNPAGESIDELMDEEIASAADADSALDPMSTMVRWESSV